MRCLVAAFVVALVFPVSGLAGYVPASDRVVQVSHIFSGQPDSTVNCGTDVKSWDSDPLTQGTWGVTFLLVDEIDLAPQMCDAVNAIAAGRADTVPLWQQAYGILVLVHESYHARHWSARGSESQVECKAIRHFVVAAELLGLTEAQAVVLRPWALAAHYRLEERHPQYDSPNCKTYWPY